MQFQPNRSRRLKRRVPQPISTINVTPFVDVMLVLLIVFMITAPLLTPSVDVGEQAEERLPTPPQQVHIPSDGTLHYQGRPISQDQLIPLLREATTANPQLKIYVNPDCDTELQEPLNLLHDLIKNRIPKTQLSLVTKPCDKPGS